MSNHNLDGSEKVDPVYFIYVRRKINSMTEDEMRSMQIDILQKLAFICDQLNIEEQTWVGIPGNKRSYRFSIKREET